MSPSDTLTVLITGANQGLGFETSRQLSKLANVHLFLTGRSAQRLDEAKAKIAAEEGFVAKLDTVLVDVTDDAEIERAAKTVEEQAGRLDVLVNNSGVVFDGNIKSRADMRKVYRETYEVNLFGVAVLVDAFLPLLKKSSNARILNISSSLGSCGLISDPSKEHSKWYAPAYTTSKSALNNLTIALGMAHKDIHVVSIDPGYVATAINGYSGPVEPKDGVKIIVKHVLKNEGRSPGYYSEHGEVPW